MTSKTNHKQTEIGEIPKEWMIRRLGDHCSIKGGKRLPKGDSLLVKRTAHPYIRIKDITADGIDKSNLLYISKETHKKISRYIINQGDVYISIVGTIGLSGVIDKDLDRANLTENAAKLTDFNELDAVFVNYYLKSPAGQRQIRSRTVGSTQPKLALFRIGDIKFPLTSKSEQQQIASILSSLDDKIELNRKMNKTLEEMGKALFKRWFVDFEFPDENGKPYKSSGGEMGNSELGLIPKGWKVKKIGDFITIDRGVSYRGKFLSSKGIPMLNLGSFNLDGSLKLDTLKYYTGDFNSSNTIRAGDIIMANTDMTQNRVILGSACIVPDSFGDTNVLFTHHVYGLRIKKGIPSSYLYRLLKENDFKNHAIGYATGTTVLFLPKEALLKYEVVLPTEEILNKFNNVYTDLIGTQQLNSYKIEILSRIRDMLLPRLMSGRLRV